MYREVAPQPRLRSLVSRVWAFPPNEHAHRVLPDGCMDIVFLDNRALPVGPMRSAILVPAQAKATLGIRMSPGEAERLFPGMAGELSDSDAPLAQLWRGDGRLLEDALLALLQRATGAQRAAQAILREALPIIERVVAARLASHGGAADLRMRAAAALLGEGASVAQVAAHVSLSERQLGRRFHARMGLHPKTFARVRRLQRAALLLKAGATPSTAAAHAGYADQPHFTRETAELAGVSPTGLRVELTDGRDTAVPVRL